MGVNLKMKNINRWSDVNWSEINTRIYRLQVRIYRASQNYDKDKTHKLQKLLTVGESAKLLAVREVTQKREGKNVLGVNSSTYLSPSKRLELARSIRLDGKTIKISKLQKKISLLGILTMEERAKQALASLALQPQWEANFDSHNTSLKSKRSVNDALEAIFVCISKKQKWVLEAYIEKGFDTINHKKLLAKCDTFPLMEKQLQAWLKAGILNEKIRTSSRGVIYALLSNIALYGLQERLDFSTNSLTDGKEEKVNFLSYVGCAGYLIIMHPDLEVIQKSRDITMKFLKEMDLILSTTKSKITHTSGYNEGPQASFQFLRVDIIQRQKCSNTFSWKSFITRMNPSKEFVNSHRVNLREIIKKHKGVSQENLIYNLNPMIHNWALSKRTQISSKIFSEMDKFTYLHLWSWARKRHPKMSHTNLKDKYWHIVGKSNWVFGIKSKGIETGVTKVSLRLRKHSESTLKPPLQMKI
jgi:RNA-directed DNA polymerase